MMRRVVVFVLASLAASALPTVAQTFPEPGTGVFTWRHVGDRPLDAESFTFAPDGQLFAAFDSVYVFVPAPGGPPNGRWQTLGRSGIVDALFAISRDTLLAGHGNGGVLSRSTDGGATWTIVNEGVDLEPGGPDAPDGFFALPSTHPHAGRVLAGGTILRSDDRGATWTEATRIAPFPGDGGFAHVFAALPSGRVLLAGNWGVAATDDGGRTWEAVGRLPTGSIGHRTRLVRLGPDGHLWVTTTINGSSRQWLWRSAEPAEAAFVVAGEDSPETGGMRLDVRPNPADGPVVVRLTLPAAASAVAPVYDALGRRVAVLHDGPLVAGAHAFALGASRLAPGVYVVQVRVAPERGGAVWTAVRRVTVAR